MYNYYYDNVAYYRVGIRAGVYVIDKSLTALSWAGAENTDWASVLKFS